MNLFLKYATVLLMILSSLKIQSQIASEDLGLVQQVNFKVAVFEYKREVHFASFKHQSIIAKYNPISLTAGSLLYIYQKYLYTQIAASCPYEISCSEFSRITINRYGLVKGILLTSDRLNRCTRPALTELYQSSNLNPKTNKLIDDPEWYR